MSDSGKSSSPSFWSEKPWWCQPWSILLTGVCLLAFSWWWPHLLWLSALLAVIVIGWWLLFLWLVPTAYRQQQQELDP